MKTLFLNPPSFQGFDGGAGSRYQARREIRSFWYPTWLAQAAALVEDSKVLDAPADGLSIEESLRVAAEYDLVIVYTSTPSFAGDARTAVRIKRQRPDSLIGFVGPHVSVLPEESLRSASAVDFVVRGEFEIPVREVARGRSFAEVRGLTWRDGDTLRRNDDSEPLEDLDSLPFVVPVYERDLTIENYYIGYLMHPYLSLYTGRGCPGQCTFCLWPQTISGHKYRVRGAESVSEELALAKERFPQVREFFIDDDTFTANPQRAIEIAGKIADLGITWSTSSRANANYNTLKALKERGLRLLMVGYESGSDRILANVHKGINTVMARRFTKDCKTLGIQIHGTFIVGLPGETKETVEETIKFARELEPDTMQVSVVAPYPGTELYRQAVENNWLVPTEMVSSDGTQVCPVNYPELSGEDILASVDTFYRRFYFRRGVIWRIGKEMAADPAVRRRRLREGREFFSFLGRRKRPKRSNVISQVIRDGGPGFCQFAITDACNARCGFCNFSADGPPPRDERAYVRLDDGCAALDVLAENGIRYLAFVGGEPTLHPNLPEFIAHATTLGMSAIVCTNGSLLKEETLDRYTRAGLDSMIISIDAPSSSAHEANRGLPGVCARIAEANDILAKAGVSSTASVTLSKLLGDLSGLPGFLESLGFRQVTFSYPLRTLESGFRGYSDSELIEYTGDELHAAFEGIKKLKRRFRVANPTASVEEMQRFIRGEPQRFPCLAGFKYFYLDWNLDLRRCHAWRKRMCSVFDFDGSRLIRDGCTCCMIDCYRDASVLHHAGIALFDAATCLRAGKPVSAVAHLFNKCAFESVKSIMEDLTWIRGL